MVDEAELSEREQEILRLVATGASNKDIALKLLISPNTVKVHLRNIFTKIEVVSRTGATLYAIRQGLVSSPNNLPAANNGIDASTFADDAHPRDETSSPISISTFEETETSNKSALSQKAAAGIRRRNIILVSGGVILAIILAFIILRRAGWVGLPVSTPTQPSIQANPEARWQVRPVLPEEVKSMAAAVYENELIIISGETPTGITGSVYQFDTTDGAWKDLATKPTPVADVTAVLLGEKIYVPGGRLTSGKMTQVLEVFDPRHDQWESKAPLPIAVSGYALAAWEGRLYLFGGWDGVHILASVYTYDPEQDRWTPRTTMPVARTYAGAAASNGKVFVIGGFDGKHALPSNEVYFPDRDGTNETPWDERTPLQTGRYAMGITSLADIIYLVGGITDNPTDQQSLQYIVQQDNWQPFENPPSPAGSNLVQVAFQDQVMILGGQASDKIVNQFLSYHAIYKVQIPSVRKSEP